MTNELSPLQARESIDRINEMAAGTGHMTSDDRRNFISELERRANSTSRRVATRPKSIAEMMSLSGRSTRFQA